MKRYFKFKYVVFFINIVLIFNLLAGCSNILAARNNVRVLDYDTVKDSVIRFHIIANSDSDEDQDLKLNIKNKVIDYLYPYLNQSESIDESREIIKQNMDKVKSIADETISESGYNYPVAVQLSRENFPDKSYGNIVLPQGNYEAFRVIIGNGEGHNWWCVMFPPLCFVDESKAEVEYDKAEDKINKSNNDKEDKKDIEVKFKFIEEIKKIFAQGD